jgi:hypothetical protein
MSTSVPKPAKRRRPVAKVGALYRGVRLQPMSGRARFSSDQIKRAVAAAVEKNPDALDRGA